MVDAMMTHKQIEKNAHVAKFLLRIPSTLFDLILAF
jgi:hypothetical protein